MKINMGCGWRNFGDDWIHIDGGDYDHLDYTDITKLELKDESVDLIYASHVIEYFDAVEVEPLLLEWKRVLKKDGILRIAVPDFESIMKLYSLGHRLTSFLGPLYGRMDMGESKIYHRTVYDFDTLSGVLNTLAFYDIKRYEWRETEHSNFDDHSQAYIPHMDKENGTLISLNVEAKRL